MESGILRNNLEMRQGGEVELQYCDTYTVGESEIIYLLFPENLDTDYMYFVSESAVTKSPCP